MANLIPAAARQPESATGKTAVAKKDSASSKTSQVDVQKQVTDVKEGVDTGTSSAKTTGKFSFNDLLKKRLTPNTSNDPSDNPQSQKQAIVNTEVTSETKKPESAEKGKKDTTNPLLSALLFTPQSLESPKKQSLPAVTNVKSLQNLPLKAIGSTKTVTVENTKAVGSAAVENTKTVAGKEVTATKPTAKESKSLSAVEQKEVKAAAEKETPNLEKIAKTSVSEPISNVSQKQQESAPNAIHLSADLTAAGKDKPQLTYSHTQVHDSTEVTKIDKSKAAPSNTPQKAQVAATTETSEIAQTVISSRQAEVVTPVLNRLAGTESVSATAVTTTPTMKSQVGQTVMTPSEQIIDKVQNTITGSTQQIQVTLNPAELGMVRITFRQQDGQIEGLMEVQNTEVRKDIEKALPQIAAALAQNGIQVRRMDIAPMHNQQSNQGAFEHPETEYNPADQHYLSNNGGSGGSGQSGGRAGGQDAQLASELQAQAQQGYDASGLNMFA
jgi:flagellar hook-length control protein FliK